MKLDYKYLKTNIHTEITDLALASVIQYLGFPIVAINKDPKESPKVGFLFDKSEELEDAVYRYWQGLILVEPKLFWSIARDLKTRIKTS